MTSICDILTKADRYDAKEDASRRIFFLGIHSQCSKKPYCRALEEVPFKRVVEYGDAEVETSSVEPVFQ